MTTAQNFIALFEAIPEDPEMRQPEQCALDAFVLLAKHLSSYVLIKNPSENDPSMKFIFLDESEMCIDSSKQVEIGASVYEGLK